MSIPPELANAAVEPVELTVGELLELFGERTRNGEIVGRIEGELVEAGLCCDPSLFHGRQHDPVMVRAIEAGQEEPEGGEEEVLAPVSLRIGDLPTARMAPGALVSLSPSDTLAHAHLVMLEKGFSQLPVMSGPYALKGVVSWQSIAMAHARGKCETLSDATDPPPEVSIEAELLVTIPDINEYNCVFVRDTDQKISGLVTSADLSVEFGRLAGPFLRLGEIERRLRRCVERMCPTLEELREATGNKKADGPEDLIVWQIQQVFAKPDRWARLGWGLPQDDFVARLNAVRQIRNQVAHFKPNPLTDDQLQQMTVFAGLVKNLVP